MSLFAEVILPLALPINYTYRIPPHLARDVAPGKRVAVQFGKSRIYSALIYRMSESASLRYEPKDILEILDEQPVIGEQQFRLWEWISSYYLCSMGEVMAAALPASLKLSSQTKVILSQDALNNQESLEALGEKEALVCQALLHQQELSMNDVSKLLGQKTVMPLIKSLIDKGIVYVSEQISPGYRPKTQTFLQLDELYRDPEKLRELFGILERSPRQLDALMTYIRLSRNKGAVPKKDLLEESGVSPGVLNALIEKEILHSLQQEVSRLPEAGAGGDEFRLSPLQEEALKDIRKAFSERKPVLLHGVTSSGKTLLYVELIRECLEKGEQVLYLLPEIAITEQMTERLRNYFGKELAVYHSRFNDNERGEIWKRVLDGSSRIILGARSALFLPFQQLGLVIVDEEHEHSYKQFDPAPRYHARDTALYLASLAGARALLGSATPSLESYYHAVQEKYALVRLGQRYGAAHLPEMVVVDMLREERKKKTHSHFSELLLNELKAVLERGKQAILFRNRRGYVPVVLCRTCGYIPQCMNCDISLTYHRSSDRLVCHYCGYSEKLSPSCHACGSSELEQRGFGTEKVEDELRILLPEARIARLDLDNTRNKYAFQQLLNEFEGGNIDILVGTQMVTKGLDFGNVALVGILDADSLFRYPDFRAFERSYQLMVQVSGRSGRRSEQGKVLIQTNSPAHPVIKLVRDNSYQAFYDAEIGERKQFHYPPFFRLIQVMLKHKEPAYLDQAAAELATLLKSRLGSRVLGPQLPLVPRVRNLYIRSFLVKIDRERDAPSKVKEILQASLREIQARHGKLLIQADVDPV